MLSRKSNYSCCAVVAVKYTFSNKKLTRISIRCHFGSLVSYQLLCMKHFCARESKYFACEILEAGLKQKQDWNEASSFEGAAALQCPFETVK